MSIDVSLRNPNPLAAKGHRNVLFTGAAKNSLLVTLTNTDAAAAGLTAGPVVAESKAGGGAPTTLVFVMVSLGGSLTDTQAAALTVTSPGWSPAQYLEGWWSLSPASSSSLAKGKAAQIHVTGWPKFPTATVGQVHVEYYRFGALSDFSVNALTVHAAPGATSRPLDIELGFGIGAHGTAVSDHVLVSDANSAEFENTLALRVTNPAESDPVPGAKTPPQFRLFFPAAKKPRRDTLATLDDGNAALLMLSPASAKNWDHQQDHLAGLPCWLLTPKIRPVLRPASSVEFDLAKLVVKPPIGTPLIYLQHSGVPGYDDGVHHLVVPKLERRKGIHVSPLTVNPPVVGANDSTTLTFHTENATSALLSIDGGTGQVSLSIGPGGGVHCKLTSTDGSTITVDQDGVTKGRLTLPSAIAPAPVAPNLRVGFRVEAEDAHGNTRESTTDLDLRPASIASFNIIRRPDPHPGQPRSLCTLVLWATHDAVASKVTLEGMPLNKLSGSYKADGDDPGPYTLSAQGFGPPVVQMRQGAW